VLDAKALTVQSVPQACACGWLPPSLVRRRMRSLRSARFCAIV